MGAKIIAAGKYVPDQSISNDQLAEWMDTSDEWIRSRTGIEYRNISTDENTSDLCIQAALSILNKAAVAPEKLGFIIVATMTPDYHSPSVAALVQHGVGAGPVMAFDISAACSGFVYALSVGEKLMDSGQYEYGLVLGGETMSKAVDWEDRSTAVLFGDGAGGVLLQKSDTSLSLAEDLHADGGQSDALTSGFTQVYNPLKPAAGSDPANQALTMDGRGIFNFVSRTVPNSLRATVEGAGMQLEEVDHYLLHQANQRLLKVVAKKLSLPISKFATNIRYYGNTSAASIPILLADMLESKELELGSGKKIVISGFGGGLTWGSMLIQL